MHRLFSREKRAGHVCGRRAQKKYKKKASGSVPEVAAGLFIVGVHEELGFQLTGGLPSGLVDFVVVIAHRVPLSGLVGFPSLSLVL